MRGYGLGLRHRASINLEMALLIALLVLAVVGSLTWMGPGIANQFLSAAGALDTAGGTSSGPTVSQPPVDNGDGTWTIGPIGGGVPDYTIIRDDDQLMPSPITIGITPGPDYTIQPIDLLPGDNYIDIIDDNGDRLPTPIVITIPRDCYSYQDELFLAVATFAADGGDTSVMDTRAIARGFLVPGFISGVAFDDATTCPDDGTPFSFIDGEFLCVNHPPLSAADCDTYQLDIAQAAFQWAQAELLGSTARPLASPTTLLAFYGEVLPYSSTARRQCAVGGEFTYYNPASNPAGVFVFLQCPSHPAEQQAVKRYCYINQMAIEAAADNYHTDFGVYPSGITDLVPGYLPEMPQCPAGGPPYTINPFGAVGSCFGGSPAHGHF